MKKVLIIDYQRSNLLTIQAAIEKFLSDCKTLQALSGKEGIEIARQEQPDTILLDVVMPEMDGFETCKRLKEDKLTQPIPIVLITAEKTDAKSRIRGFEAGADAFLTKPIDPDELIAQLKVMLRIKEAEDKLRDEKNHLEEVIKERTQAIKEKEYSDLFDKMGDAVFVTKLGGKDAGCILEVNNAATLQSGYSRGELLKKNITDDLVIGLSKLGERNKLEEKLNRGEIISVTEKKKKKDGTVMWAEVTLAPYWFRGEKAVIGINRDITQRREDEEKLRAMLQKLTKSEERFRELTDLLPQVVYETDFDGNFTFVNKYGLSLFGYSSNDIKSGLNFMQIIAPEEKRHVIENIQQYLSGNTDADTDYVVLDKAGNKIPVQIFSSLIYREGKPDGWRGVIVDITKRKKAEEAIRESEQQLRTLNQQLEKKNHDLKLSSERYKALIAVSHTGTWEYHSDTGYLWRSDECFKMLGRNREDYDFSGAPNLKEVWIDLLHPDDRERASKHFLDFIKNGSKGMYENYYRLQHSDGHWVWILSRGNTLRDENGKVTSITLGTHIDITEQKKVEEELKNRMEELEIFNDASVNRELMINDLRREVNELLFRLGEGPKYEVVE